MDTWVSLEKPLSRNSPGSEDGRDRIARGTYPPRKMNEEV
jgi:hypothetical protein